MEIYHQLGFQYSWNLASLKDDDTGTGVIFTPKFMGPKDIAKLQLRTISSGIFDPQFFLPNTALGKLSEYDFFPDSVSDGFSTTDYPGEFARESAERCVR